MGIQTTWLMPSNARKRQVLLLLTLLYALNFLDRGVMAVLLQPIKGDLRLTDTQLGFLMGIAFGLFYATLGLPIARWADRGDRVTIASASIGLWGVTMMAGVLVTNYIQLVFARIAAGVGEAGSKPPAYSLIGDYFPEPAERAQAMAVYISGSYLSALAGYPLAGWLNDAYGWRITFLLIGIPGLLLALVVKHTVEEPRLHAYGLQPHGRPLPSLRSVFLTLWRKRSCRQLCFALILLYLMGIGMNPWYAAFMMRSHGMTTSQAGIWLGIIFGLGGMTGVLFGGFVAGRWFAGNERGQMRMSAVAVSLLVPCFVAFLLLPHEYQALIALLPLMVVFSVFLGPTYALMQRLVPDEMRATMMALVMLLANLIGFGIGPQIVGIGSDLLRPVMGADSLRYAMLAVSFVALWAAYHFWLAGRTIKEDLALAAIPHSAGLP